jgi:hypothetical protein
VAWAVPEVEVGVELEVMPLELVELEEEPVLVDPVEEEEPELVELEGEEPVLVDPVEDDEPVEARLVEAASAVCVDPGSTKATAPAATTLATPTVAVATRTRARPRVLAVTAAAIGSGCELDLVMSPSLDPGAHGRLQATSELPMKSGAPISCCSAMHGMVVPSHAVLPVRAVMRERVVMRATPEVHCMAVMRLLCERGHVRRMWTDTRTSRQE